MVFTGTDRTAALALDDGRIFPGWSFGARAQSLGEVVFTTCMTGYQEIATDPSFRGQTGLPDLPDHRQLRRHTRATDESRQPWVSALIVREYVDEPSHWEKHLTRSIDYLKAHRIPGIHGVDTPRPDAPLADAGVAARRDRPRSHGDDATMT